MNRLTRLKIAKANYDRKQREALAEELAPPDREKPTDKMTEMLIIYYGESK